MKIPVSSLDENAVKLNPFVFEQSSYIVEDILGKWRSDLVNIAGRLPGETERDIEKLRSLMLRFPEAVTSGVERFAKATGAMSEKQISDGLIQWVYDAPGFLLAQLRSYGYSSEQTYVGDQPGMQSKAVVEGLNLSDAPIIFAA